MVSQMWLRGNKVKFVEGTLYDSGSEAALNEVDDQLLEKGWRLEYCSHRHKLSENEEIRQLIEEKGWEEVFGI